MHRLASVVMLVSFAGTAESRAFMPQVTQLDAVSLNELQKPFKHWLSELSAPTKERRDLAASVLKEAARLVHASDVAKVRRAGTPEVGFVATFPGIPPAEERTLAERYRGEFLKAVPDMIKLLELRLESNATLREDPAADALTECLAASWPDGRGIVLARKTLPPSIESDRMLLWLLIYGSSAMPAEKTLHSVLIRELKTLCPESKQKLAKMWADIERGVPSRLISLQLGLLPMGVLTGICERDATQKELPLFVELLDARYPSLIRLGSLACLSELRHEAERALPAVRKLLDDESKMLRRAAASTVVTIELDATTVKSIADRARLMGIDRTEFIEHAAEIIEHAILEFDIADMQEILRASLSGNNSVEKRHVLRIIRSNGLAAKSLEPDVRKALQDKDPETRRFAKLALEAIGTEP